MLWPTSSAVVGVVKMDSTEAFADDDTLVVLCEALCVIPQRAQASGGISRRNGIQSVFFAANWQGTQTAPGIRVAPATNLCSLRRRDFSTTLELT
jgi:hypothetical protein